MSTSWSSPPPRPAAPALAALALAAAGCAHAPPAGPETIPPMPAPSTPANPPAPGAAAPVAVALSVAPLGAGPAATVRFTNTSGRPFPLARYLACQGETLEHNVFTITDADAKRVPYVGPMIKRAAPGDADFITLAPGQSLEGTVRLDAAYALAASKGPFRVRYSAFNPSHAPWPLTKLESPEVPFDWRP